MYQDSWEIEHLLGPGQGGYLFALTGPDKILAYARVLTGEQVVRYIQDEESVPEEGFWIAAAHELVGQILHLRVERGVARIARREEVLVAFQKDAVLLGRLESAVVFQARQDWDAWSMAAPVYGEA